MKRLPSLVTSLIVFPSLLFSQAWLSPKGQGTVSLSYQNVYVRNHVFTEGEAADRGHVLSDALTLDVDYSFTNRFAARIAIPYLAAKYTGSKPHLLSIDGGTYHATFQDFSIDLRYNLSSRPVVLTPFFRVVVPSHHYEYFAHSAVGRDLREFHVGTNLGRRLDPFLPKGYLQARYSYIFVERVLNISPNRSNAEVQFGYFLTPRLSLLGTLQGQYTHSGLNYHLATFPNDITKEQFLHHDQIAKTDLLDLGGGLSFAVNRSWGFFVTVGRSIAGRNGHLHASVVTAGVSRSFGGRSEVVGTQSAEDALELGKTFVCTCARSK